MRRSSADMLTWLQRKGRVLVRYIILIQAAAAQTHPARSQSDSGPEYLFPFIIMYLTKHPCTSIVVVFSPRPNIYALVTAPPWGLEKEGARNPRSQKLCFRIANTQVLHNKGYCGERAPSLF